MNKQGRVRIEVVVTHDVALYTARSEAVSKTHYIALLGFVQGISRPASEEMVVQKSPPSGVFGFNTTVKVGDVTYHVQTEDHGLRHPFVDTVVYVAGRVLSKTVESYGHLLETPDFSTEQIGRLLEAQHRAVIEAIRGGAIAATPASPAGIQILLLNPANCLRPAEAVLQIEIRGRPAGESLADVRVEVRLRSTGCPPVEIEGTTNGNGRIDFRLPLPPLSAGGADLRIRAVAGTLTDEVRYSVRRKD